MRRTHKASIVGPGWEVGGLEEEVSRSLPSLSSRAEAPRGAPEGHLVCRARCPHRLRTALSGAFMCFEINQPGGDAPPPPSLPPQEGSGHRVPGLRHLRHLPVSGASQGAPYWLSVGTGTPPTLAVPTTGPPGGEPRAPQAWGAVWNLRCRFFFLFFFLNQISFLTGSVSGGVNTDPYSLYPHQPACF